MVDIFMSTPLRGEHLTLAFFCCMHTLLPLIKRKKYIYLYQICYAYIIGSVACFVLLLVIMSVQLSNSYLAIFNSHLIMSVQLSNSYLAIFNSHLVSMHKTTKS